MCECIKIVNEQLAEYNTQILLPMFIVGGGVVKPFVETVKLDEKKRVKPRRMFATYCPFCGAQYPEIENLKPPGGDG